MSMTYVGRHNPRKHVVVAGLVDSPERYDKYYDLACEALQAGILPLRHLPAGKLLFRKLARSIEDARTIGPSSSQALTNRYSGARLDGRDGQGALYLGTLAGILREHVHYTLHPPPQAGAASIIRAVGSVPGQNQVLRLNGPDRTRDQINRELLQPGAPAGPGIFHVYRLDLPVLMADIRVLSLARWLGTMLSTPAARRRFGIVEHASLDLLVQTVLSPTDYSAARGLADAIADLSRARGLGGLCATSARGDTDTGVVLRGHGDGVEGEVYVLFGASGQRVSALAPVASYASFKELLDGVKVLPGFAPRS